MKSIYRLFAFFFFLIFITVEWFILTNRVQFVARPFGVIVFVGVADRFNRFSKIPFCRTRKWIRRCDEAEYRFRNQNPAAWKRAWAKVTITCSPTVLTQIIKVVNWTFSLYLKKISRWRRKLRSYRPSIIQVGTLERTPFTALNFWNNAHATHKYHSNKQFYRKTSNWNVIIAAWANS